MPGKLSLWCPAVAIDLKYNIMTNNNENIMKNSKYNSNVIGDDSILHHSCGVLLVLYIPFVRWDIAHY